jgi:hypothetical protein
MGDGASISAILAAIGLSGACGLNAWLPLLLAGLLQRAGVIDLGASWHLLYSDGGLLLLAVLTMIDFVGDKIPVLDSLLHRVGVVTHPVVGAFVFSVALGTAVPQAVELVAGGAIASGVHLIRAALRPVVTAGERRGATTTRVSFTEDVASLLLAIVSFVWPLVAGAGVLALLTVGAALVLRERRGPVVAV